MALSLQIKTLSWRHKSMARAVVYGGLTPKELVDEYGMSNGQISVILRSPIFQVECARLESMAEAESGNVRGLATDMAPVAGRVVQKRLHAALKREEPDRCDIDTAFGILKLAAPDEGQKHLHLHQHEHREAAELNDEELRKDVFDAVEWRDS